jgi:hypothetical protein
VAATYRSASQNAAYAAGTTGLTINKPSGVANGDTLIAFIGRGDDAGGAFSCSGWSQANGTSDGAMATTTGNDIGSTVLFKHITDAGSEPSSYTFVNTDTASQNMAGFIVCVQATNPSDPIDEITEQSGTNSWTPNQVDITTGVNGALVLAFHVGNVGTAAAKTAGAPSGMTLIGSIAESRTTSNYVAAEAAYQEAANAGTVTIGSWTGTPTDTTSEWHVYTVSVAGVAAQTITGTRYSDSDSFGAGTVAPQAVSIAGTLFSDGDSFGAHTVGVPPTVLISFARLKFPEVTGVQGLTGAIFNDGDVFGAGLVVPQPVTLTGTRYADSDSFGSSSISVAGDVREPFEDVIGNWVVTPSTSGIGSVVERSNSQAYAGTYSARCFTTEASAQAFVYDTFSSPWSSVPTSPPGDFNWQRARIFIPTATVNALTGTEYIRIAGMHPASGNGMRLEIRQSGAMYLELASPYGGTSIFSLHDNFPINQWVEVELGLWSLNTGDIARAATVIINGKFYGWNTRMAESTNYDRVSWGILATNSADDLEIFVDNLYDMTTGQNLPSGTDNRPTGNSYTKNYLAGSGENIGYHYSTFTENPQIDTSNGIYPGSWRIQAGPEMSQIDMESGWSEIKMGWVDDATPTWPPPGEFFAPMIAFHKSVELEENLEITIIYSGGTVYLTYESWDPTTVFEQWQLPLDGSYRYPGNGDKIRVRWQVHDTNYIHVIADYYDASAGTWSLAVIDDDRQFTGSYAKFLDQYHQAVTSTIDSPDYAIEYQTAGIYSTFPTDQTLTGTKYSDADSFGASSIASSQLLSGTVFNDTDSFGSSSVSAGGTSLIGTVFSDSDSFGADSISLNLAGTSYSDTDNFGAALVSPGAVSLTGTAFSDTDSYGSHTIVVGLSLTGNLFVDGDGFGVHSVSVGAVSLAGIVYSDIDSFGEHVIAAGTILVGIVFTDPESFGTSSLAVGAVSITGIVYTDGDGFGNSAITLGGAVQNLSAAQFVDADNFGSGAIGRTISSTLHTDPDHFGASTISPQSVTISGTTFVDADSFPGGVLNLFGYVIGTLYQDSDTFPGGSIVPGAIAVAGTLYLDPDSFGSSSAHATFIALVLLTVRTRNFNLSVQNRDLVVTTERDFTLTVEART